MTAVQATTAIRIPTNALQNRRAMQAAIPAHLPLTVVVDSSAQMANAQLRARHQAHAQWIPTAVQATTAAPTATAQSDQHVGMNTHHAIIAVNAASLMSAQMDTAQPSVRTPHARTAQTAVQGATAATTATARPASAHQVEEHVRQTPAVALLINV